MNSPQQTLEALASPYLARLQEKFVPKHPNDWAYLIADARRIIVDANGNAIDNLGLKKSDLVGSHLIDLIYQKDLGKFIEGCHLYEKDRKYVGFYMGVGIRISKDTYKHYRLSSRFLFQEETQAGYFVALGNETEQKSRSPTARKIVVAERIRYWQKTIERIKKLGRASAKNKRCINLEGINYDSITKKGRKKDRVNELINAIDAAIQNPSVNILGLYNLDSRLYTPLRDLTSLNARDPRDLGFMELSPTERIGKIEIYHEDGKERILEK